MGRHRCLHSQAPTCPSTCPRHAGTCLGTAHLTPLSDTAQPAACARRRVGRAAGVIRVSLALRRRFRAPLGHLCYRPLPLPPSATTAAPPPPRLQRQGVAGVHTGGVCILRKGRVRTGWGGVGGGGSIIKVCRRRGPTAAASLARLAGGLAGGLGRGLLRGRRRRLVVLVLILHGLRHFSPASVAPRCLSASAIPQ